MIYLEWIQKKKKGSKVWFEIEKNFETIKIASEEILNKLKHEEWKTTYTLLASFIQAEGDILDFENEKILDFILGTFRKNKISDGNNCKKLEDFKKEKIFDKTKLENFQKDNKLLKNGNSFVVDKLDLKKNSDLEFKNENCISDKDSDFDIKKQNSILDNKLSFRFFANSLHYAMNSHVI